jgi:multidrug efflux system membrane fusion protein
MIDVGNVISPSDAGIVVVTQLEPIAVIFSLPADQVVGIPLGGSNPPIPVVAFGRDDRTELATGRLELIDNRIDPTTNTVRLKAIFTNRDARLKPGEFVNAHLVTSTLRHILAAPARAIQYSDHGAFVWLLRSDSRVELRPVATGPKSGGFVAIEHGLEPGDRVVIAGQYDLRSGSLVSVHASQAPSAAGGAVLDVP